MWGVYCYLETIDNPLPTPHLPFDLYFLNSPIYVNGKPEKKVMLVIKH